MEEERHGNASTNGESMSLLPEAVPISKFRASQREILAEVSREPILLTRYGRGIAVLLGPESYDQLIGKIEDLQLALDAVEARGEDTALADLQDYIAERADPSAM